jgi:hypothetical protein
MSTEPPRLPPGIHLGISDETYHADPAPIPSLSSGIAFRLITSSPMHARAKHPRLAEEPIVDEAETVLERGQLAHLMLLGDGFSKIVPVDPTQFLAEKTGNVPDGWTNKAIRAERDRIRGLGKIPVFKQAYEQAQLMCDRAHEALRESELGLDLKLGDSEVTLIWEDEADTGRGRAPLMCRAKADWWSHDRQIMLDYKSTAGLAEPESWIRRQVGTMGYDLQGAHYRRGARRLGGKEPLWVFLVQENYYPYACSFVGLSESMWEIAEGRRHRAYGRWAECMKTGEWPGYGPRVAYATPSSWQMEEHSRSLDELIEQGAQI